MAKKTSPKSKVAKSKPKLLSGGNPQIAKADGDAPVRAYIAAMPGWKRDVGRRLDALITRTVPGVRKAVKWAAFAMFACVRRRSPEAHKSVALYTLHDIWSSEIVPFHSPPFRRGLRRSRIISLNRPQFLTMR